MIAKARVIPHGNAYTNYSTMKKDSEYVGSLHLDGDMTLNVDGDMDFAWDEFRDEKFKYKGTGKDVTNTLIAIEASPAMEESAHWTLDEWHEYAIDLLKHIDALEFKDKNGRVSAPRTNLMNSKALMMLHHDSKSGIPHLHIMVSRFTVDGEINSGNLIGMKAVTAANQLNQERGWKQPEEISRQHRAEIKDACYDILRSMKSWNFNAYLDELNRRGYPTETRLDKNQKIVGYYVSWDNSRYRACDIGANLTAAKLQREWQKLHPKRDPVVHSDQTGKIRPDKVPSKSVVKDYVPMTASWTVPGSNMQKQLNIKFSRNIYDKFHSVASSVEGYDDYGNEVVVAAEDVMKTAAMIYLGFIQDATDYSVSVGGGGSTGGSYDKDDEDEHERIRKAMERARSACRPTGRPRIKRRR